MSDKTFKLLYIFLIVSGTVILAIKDHTYLASVYHYVLLCQN